MDRELIDVYIFGISALSEFIAFDNLKELTELFEADSGSAIKDDYLEEDWEELQRDIAGVHKAIESGLDVEPYSGEYYQVWHERRSREWFESLPEQDI